VAVGNPDPPVINSLAAGANFIDVYFTERNNSGCGSATWEFSRNGGSNWQTSTRFGELENGLPYTIVGRTVLGSSCGTPGQTYTSVNGNTQSAIPYGPLVRPTITASGAGTTRITWNWNHQRAKDGRPDWNASLSGDCGSANITDQPTGSVFRDFTPDGSPKGCTITVSAGGQALDAYASARVQDPPNPTGSTYRTGSYTGTGCSSGTCKYIGISIDDFPPNSPIAAQCEKLDLTFTASHQPGSTDGAGAFNAATNCWAGCAYNTVVRVTVGSVTRDLSSPRTC
jgi:hypothetical protein